MTAFLKNKSFALLLLALGTACGSSPAATQTETVATSEPAATAEPEAEAPEEEAPPVEAEPETPEPVDLMAVEMAAYEAAKPVFEDQCGMCHTPEEGRKKPKKGVGHFSMAGYPFGGHHSAELGQTIRVSIGGTDKAATMPQDDPGSLEGKDLELLLAWADAFDAAAAAKVGYHANPDHGHEHKHQHKAKKPKHKKGKHAPKKGKHGHDHGHKHAH
jgi:ribosomal protein L12E/L44/L45/RPP1/RPP2